MDKSTNSSSSSSPCISVVSPVYGCHACLFELYMRLVKTLSTITDHFEIILVDDASPDNVWEDIKELAQRDNRVKGIRFSRNFGQQYAINAGLEHYKGDWVVVLDCDLQDQPEEILNLYKKAEEGFDIVLASRARRKDNFTKKIYSRIFYGLLSYLTDQKHDCSVANFGIYKKTVIDSVLSMNDSVRYFPTMVQWVGFRSITIEVNHSERIYYKTGYSFDKLLRLALDIILSFSDKPLRLTVKLGLILSFSSLLFALYFLIRYFLGLVIIQGWTSLIVSVWFLSGVVIFVLGVIGLYVGKTFERVKDRPLYIISDKTNF